LRVRTYAIAIALADNAASFLDAFLLGWSWFGQQKNHDVARIRKASTAITELAIALI
jgi:hypothetical protein